MSVELTLALLAIAIIVILVVLLLAVVPPWLGRRSPLLPAEPRDGNGGDRWGRGVETERWSGPGVMGGGRSVADRLADLRASGGGVMDGGEPPRADVRAEARPRADVRADARPRAPEARPRPPEAHPPRTGAPPELATRDARGDEATTGAYDRIVRIVALVFIMAAITVVTVSGVWPIAENGVTLLLVVAALAVVVVHDLLPAGFVRSLLSGIEGPVALLVAGLLVLFTGRQDSPFFLAFPLIVAGAALVVSPRATLVMALFASLTYILVVALGPGTDLGAATVSTVSVNVVALILLAYLSMVIARMQRKSRDAAIRMSTIDAMTGLYNRPFLFSAIEQEISRSTRTGRGFCLLMMDLDELKTINDRYGHFIGDRALRAVADVIRYGVRKIDIPARYGGDEFVVLLPETDPTGGYVLGEKIRQGVAELVVPGTEVRTSMSVGMVSYPDDGRTADELMISADRAMYASKRLGKNRVMGAPTGPGGHADAPV